MKVLLSFLRKANISSSRRDSLIVLNNRPAPFVARGMNKKKGYMKIKEIRGNEISPVLPFPSHERAKLVLFYNPSAAATRRGGPRSFTGSAVEEQEGKRDRKEREERDRERERDGEESFRTVGWVSRRGWNGCQLVF